MTVTRNVMSCGTRAERHDLHHRLRQPAVLSNHRQLGRPANPGVLMQNLADTPRSWRVSETQVRLGFGMARKPSGGCPSKSDRDGIVTQPAPAPRDGGRGP